LPRSPLRAAASSGAGADIVALHGFTQRGGSFDELSWFLEIPLEAPDLPGHGDVPPRPWDAAVDGVVDLAASRPEPPILLGYSMGGRLALAAALRRPAAISSLVLISAGPGIADAAERAARRRADEELAAHIEDVGVPAFVDEWLARPMFAGLASRGERWRREDRRRRVENRAGGLAGALRALGQGMQPDLWPELGELDRPVLLVVGERDARYRTIAAAMEERLPDVSSAVVRDAGHAVVGERPETVAEAVLAFVG